MQVPADQSDNLSRHSVEDRPPASHDDGIVLAQESVAVPGGWLHEISRVLRAGVLIAAPLCGAADLHGQQLAPPPPAGPFLPPLPALAEPGESASVAAVPVMKVSPHAPVPARPSLAGEGLYLQDGGSLSGKIVSIGSEGVHLESPGKAELVEHARLLRLVSDGAGVAVRPEEGPTVMFSGGGRLSARLESMANRMVRILPRAGEVLELESQLVYAVRFVPDADYDRSWDEILERDRSLEDLLVIKKPDGMLDYLKGGISNISAEKLSFYLEEQTLNVSRAKVFGIVFGQRGSRKSDAPAQCVLETADHILLCQNLELRQGQFSLKTVQGVSLKLPADQFRLDFTPSRARTFSEVGPVVKRWNPLAGVEGADLHRVMLDAWKEPLSYRQVERDRFSLQQVSVAGVATIFLPLRCQFSSMNFEIEGRCSEEGIRLAMEYQDGSRTERVVKVSESVVEKVCQPVEGVRSMTIEVPARAQVIMTDAQFIRRLP